MHFKIDNPINVNKLLLFIFQSCYTHQIFLPGDLVELIFATYWALPLNKTHLYSRLFSIQTSNTEKNYYKLLLHIRNEAIYYNRLLYVPEP